MIDRTTPISGPVAHVYVPRSPSNPVCVCGLPRFVGCHVADDGTPVPDLAGLVAALDTVREACEAAIGVILGQDGGGDVR